MSKNFDNLFQDSLLSILIYEKEFFSEYGNYLDRSYFSSKEKEDLFIKIQDIYSKYTDLPISNIEEELINSLDDEENKELKEYFLKLKECYFNPKISLSFVKDKILFFIRKENVSKAIIKSVDIIKNSEMTDEDCSRIVNLMYDSTSIGFLDDEGLSCKDLSDLKDKYEEMYNNKTMIKTGIPELDEVFIGGLGPKEVHCFCAPPKVGKSTFGCCLGAYNVAKKKIVFHFTLEIKDIDVLLKYACRFSNLSYSELITCDNEEFKKRIKKFSSFDNLFIKYYPGGTLTCSMIKSYIRKMCKKRFPGREVSPDLIIIDYDDFLIPNSGVTRDEYHDAGEVYTDMGILADFFNCPVVTFSQPTREAWSLYETDGSLISSIHVAHSAKKIHRVHSFSSLNFKWGDSNGILYLDRNRRGESGKIIRISRDLSRCYFGPMDNV